MYTFSISGRSDKYVFCMQKWHQKQPTACVIYSQLLTSCRALLGYRPSTTFDCHPSCAVAHHAMLQELFTVVSLMTWTSDCGHLSAMQPALPMLWSVELSINWSRRTSVLIFSFLSFSLSLWWFFVCCMI